MIFQSPPIVILAGGLAKQQRKRCFWACADGRPNLPLGGLAIGRKLKHSKWQGHSKCPLCNAPSETVSHVLHCKDPQAVQFAKTRIQETLKPNSQSWKQKRLLLRLSLTLQPSITATFQSGRHCTHITSRRLSGAQKQIGRANWMLGRWSPRWQRVQSNHPLSIGSKKSPRRWTSGII